MIIQLSSQWIRTISLALMCCLLFFRATPAYSAQDWQKEDTVDYTFSELRKSNFAGEDVSRTSFAGADLQESNFENTNLEGSILTTATFMDANLKSANLREVFGDRVDFTHADLSDAIFVDSILTSSHFYDATIQGADFSGAIVDPYEVKLMCKSAEGINSTTGVATQDSLGC